MPKYDANTKRARNQAIVAFHKTNPHFSLKEIGVMFANDGKPLSPQRIHQIISRAKV